MPERPTEPLSPDDHNAPKARWQLVYPVNSRRAGGLSIGINLNPGKECNWACVYCEVEGLVRGAPQPIDLELLERELGEVLEEARAGCYGHGPVRDFSIAGDGEPTLSASFRGAVEIVAKVRESAGLQCSSRLVVISNGSRAHRPEVAAALSVLGAAGGELWFKLDSGRVGTRGALNGIEAPNQRIVENIHAACALVPTWIQTMAVHPYSSSAETVALAGLLADLLEGASAKARPEGVLLYGLRRPSQQPGSADLSPLSGAELRAVADTLREGTGLTVDVFE